MSATHREDLHDVVGGGFARVHLGVCEDAQEVGALRLQEPLRLGSHLPLGGHAHPLLALLRLRPVQRHLQRQTTRVKGSASYTVTETPVMQPQGSKGQQATVTQTPVMHPQGTKGQQATQTPAMQPQGSKAQQATHRETPAMQPQGSKGQQAAHRKTPDMQPQGSKGQQATQRYIFHQL